MNSKTNVSVGVATVSGYSVTAVSVALAILAYLQGDHTQQTVGVIVAGATAIASFLVTQAGRYLQAHALAKGPQLPPDGNDSVHAVDMPVVDPAADAA